MRMEKTTGYLTDPEPKEDTIQVFDLEKGDICSYNGQICFVAGFFRNSRGNKCVRMGAPKDPRVYAEMVRWASKNPHRVKRLSEGFLV